ncbi:MAG: hypothetical protein HJJLKODD_02086 [Phycisphaerae bacterium]|nr:hypothetical protein [Phycisphaerae bacterium]
MDYQQYVEQANQAARFVEVGDFSAAINILQALLQSDISDIDKSLMSYNIAVVCDKMGDATTALQWYDHGIEMEGHYFHYYVAEQKAAYLAQQGQVSQSIELYEHLLNQSFITESDKNRIAQNLELLRRRSSPD